MSTRPRAFAVSLATAAVATAAARPAAAGDGVYGRFDGDVTLAAGAGPVLASGGASAGALARATYLDTAGLYATYADAFGADRPWSRSWSGGVELRPLFLARWATNHERGPARLDLALDSLSLGLGAFGGRYRDAAPRTAGLETTFGLGVPLGTTRDGLWIDALAGVRWPDVATANGEGRTFSLLVALSVRTSFDAHLVDAGDEVYR